MRGNIEARGILLCLRYAPFLRPSVSLAEGLADAVGIFFGFDGEAFAHQLESGQLPLFGLGCMRQALLCLGLIHILYPRLIFTISFCISVFVVGSSAQLGRNYLCVCLCLCLCLCVCVSVCVCVCVREELVRYPRDVMHLVDVSSAFYLNAGFESRVMPLSTLQQPSKRTQENH